MKRALIFFIFSLISHSAFAGLLIEPYVGSMQGTMYADYRNPATFNDTKVSGSVYGARLGFKVLLVWVAADYLGTSGKMSYNKPAGNEDDSFNSDHAFIDVGVDLPFLFRFWVGTGVYNSMRHRVKGEATETITDYVYKGSTATRAGLGFSVMHFFSVNLEYVKPNYKTYEIEGVSETIDTDFSRFDSEMTFATISFPLNLF